MTSNKDGYFAFAAVLPGTYTVKVEAPSFKTWQQTDIIMHPGDTRSVSGIQLEVGTASQTVEVVASSTAIAPVDSGARESMLTQTEINDIPLVSRNLSEVLKILPGVTTTPNGISGGSGFVGSFLSLGLTGSTIGVGLNINGSAYRGGTGYTLGRSRHSRSWLQLLVHCVGGSGHDAGSSGADIQLRRRRPARAGSRQRDRRSRARGSTTAKLTCTRETTF